MDRALVAAVDLARKHMRGRWPNDAAMLRELRRARAIVDAGVSVNLTEAQRAALTLFAAEVGPGERGAAHVGSNDKLKAGADGFVMYATGAPSGIRMAIEAGAWARVAEMIRRWKGGYDSIGSQIRRALMANMVQPETKLDEVMRWEKT